MLPLVNPLLHTLVLLVAMAITASGAESRVVFTEAFDHTGNHPLGFTDVCEIHEAPPSLKHLAFRPLANKSSEVYRGLFRFPQRGGSSSDGRSGKERDSEGENGEMAERNFG